jgi:hypothetical protein
MSHAELRPRRRHRLEGPHRRAPDEGELQRRRLPRRADPAAVRLRARPGHDALRNVAGGVLWLTVLFSGVLSFNRSYEQELENGALELLLLYPGDRRSIFLGKLLANLLSCCWSRCSWCPPRRCSTTSRCGT